MRTQRNRHNGWLIVRNCLLILIAVSLPSCSSSETPAAPPPPPDPPAESGGVTIYERANYGGASYTLRGSIGDLSNLPGPCTGGNWNECISSIKVSGGYTAVLHEEEQGRGDGLPVSRDIPNLDAIQGCGPGDWDNCAESILVSQ